MAKKDRQALRLKHMNAGNLLRTRGKAKPGLSSGRRGK